MPPPVLIALLLTAGMLRPGAAQDDSAQLEWIQEYGHPLDAVEAGTDPGDLDVLWDIVGDTRLVALGEGTHGSREFFQLKHRLLEFLVTEMEFDVLAIDAFSGDAIPIHLLTVESLVIYRQHLRPDGILAIHVSNRFVELVPVVRRLGEELDMTSVSKNITSKG